MMANHSGDQLALNDKRDVGVFQKIYRVLGWYFFGFSFLFLIPFAVSLYYDMHTFEQGPKAANAFIFSLLVCQVIGLPLIYLGRSSTERLFRREGIAIVVIIWLVTPALAALPFLFSHTLTNPMAAYFEATSGLTTTGSTCMQAKVFDDKSGKEIPIVKTVPGVIPVTYTFWGTIDPVKEKGTGKVIAGGVEAVSKGILFWRSFLQWFGGGGIVVLFVAIFPVLGVGGELLFQTEMPGPIKDTFYPRIKETAINLWKIYLGLTVIEILLLYFSNPALGLFDSVTIAFAALSTGGFSVRNASIGAYESAVTDWVVIVCMLIGSVNFMVYYHIFKGKFYRIFDPELLLFSVLVLIGGGAISFFLLGENSNPLTGDANVLMTTSESIRQGFFQVVSCISTTGFATANYDLWPYPAQVIMLLAMFFGGMSGSTAGGIKTIRLLMLFRIAQYKVESLFQPERIRTFRIGEKEVDSSVIVLVLCFFLVMITTATLGTFLFILDGVDPETALGLVACMMNGTGLTFRVGSPLDSCAFLTNFGYFLSSALMIMGRLEYFAVLAVLVPAFWRPND